MGVDSGGGGVGLVPKLSRFKFLVPCMHACVAIYFKPRQCRGQRNYALLGALREP